MSDTKSDDDKTLSVNVKKTLSLKPAGVTQGTVRQNFSHGRTKQVVVETKKRKFPLPGEKPAPVVVAPVLVPKPAPVVAKPVVVEAPKPKPAPVPERPGVVLNELSREEMDARRRALEGSKVREVEDRQRATEEARRRAEEEERRKKEREESARRQAEEEARLQKEAEARKRAEEDARRRAPATTVEAMAPDDDDRGKPRAKGLPPKRIATPEPARPTKTKGEEDRRRGKLTLNTALSDGDARGRSLSAMRRRQEKFKRGMQNEPREKIAREVILPETITIQDLASRMAERAVDVVKYFMKQGQIMKPGDLIDADTAELVASEFGHTVKRVAESDIEAACSTSPTSRRTWSRVRRS
jgi:translation initiation factor IF-2